MTNSNEILIIKYGHVYDGTATAIRNWSLFTTTSSFEAHVIQLRVLDLGIPIKYMHVEKF